MKLSEVLRERGYVYQHSSGTLEEITDGQKRTLYLGVDPTADSMHVGQLQGVLVLRRFVDDGHKLIIIVGGGTGMIGDPGGRSAERNLLDDATIDKNAEALRKQFKQLLGGPIREPSASNGAGVDFKMVNNADWLRGLNLMEFLRDVGKHFTVNEMIKRDSVRPRLETPDASISFTEFSYMLLQAYDYLELHKRYGCDLQVGGSDQWGNILSGVELIRRTTGDTAYAFSWPLLVDKATGKKFGKSEGGTVWLDAKKTSVSDFYQFWFRISDDAVEELLLKMTLLARDEIASIMTEHAHNPSKRHAQRVLARAVTELAHSKDGVHLAEEVKDSLFVKVAEDITASDIAMLEQSGLVYKVGIGTSIVDALVGSELATSKREARQFLSDGAVLLNGEKVRDRGLDPTDFKNGNAILKRGKRNVCVLVLG